MPKKRSKNKGSPDLGETRSYEIHFFVPGSGFRAAFYRADSKEQALQLLKRDYPAGRAFWVAPTRGKALGSPVPVKYRVWWKSYGGDHWDPHFVFLFDEADNLIGSVPDVGDVMAQQSWLFALSRVGNPNHKIEEVDKFNASILANEIQGASAMFQEEVLRDWEAGKFDKLDAGSLPDIDWPETGEPESGPSLEGLRDIPLPPKSPKPEMWDLEAVARAIRAGFTFGLPFVMGESLFSPNAYWIGGQQYVAYLLTVGPEHTPELQMTPEGWLRVKLFFQPFMVPERTWTGPPNENGVVAVYADIDPATVDWALLNRDF